MPRTRDEWHGDEIRIRARRAIGRAAVGITERGAAAAKRHAHVISGDLRRSIHTAPGDYIGLKDEELIQRGTDLNDEPLITANQRNVIESVRRTLAVAQFGSWLPYACVEEMGRQHRFVSPAAEEVGPTGVITLQAAFRAEGLV